MSDAKQYRVTVQFPEDINAEQRIREGIVVRRDVGYEGPLTDEQLEAIRADRYLTIEGDAEGDGPSTPAPLTKAELLAQAETEGLVLDLPSRPSRDAIVSAIEAARGAGEVAPEVDVEGNGPEVATEAQE